MAITHTGSHRNLLSPAVSQRTPSDPADVFNAPETKSAPRRSFKPGDVAVYHAGIWSRSRSPSRHNEPLFAHRFGPTTQAGRAMDRALKELAPGMFQAVVERALKAAQVRVDVLKKQQTQDGAAANAAAQVSILAEALATAMHDELNAQPALRQFLHELNSEITAQSSGGSTAYFALAYCGLKPALQAVRAQVVDRQSRTLVNHMLDALPGLGIAGAAGRALSARLEDLKKAGPGSAELAAYRQEQLLDRTRKAMDTVKGRVAELDVRLSSPDAGKAVLLSPAWASARTHIEAALKVGAGEFFQDLANQLAMQARQKRMGNAEMAEFFAMKMRATLPQLKDALGPTVDLLRGMKESVDGWTRGKLAPPDTGKCVLPNMVMVLGLAQAAKSSAAFADGAHKQALEVFAKVACAVAQGDAGSLTRWLRPGQAKAVTEAVGVAAFDLRNALEAVVAQPAPGLAPVADRDHKHVAGPSVVAREPTAPTVQVREPVVPVDDKHTPYAQQGVSGVNVNPARAVRPLEMLAVKARDAVQAAVSTLDAKPDSLDDAGKSVLLSPAWTAARTAIEAAMKAGAGQFFEQLAKPLATQAREQRMDSTEMALFFAKQLRFALPKIKVALGPVRGLIHGVQAGVNKSALVAQFPFTRDCVLPNMVMVLGLAKAATAQGTLLADGAGKQALETLAEVARAVAQDDDASLTHGLRPAQAFPICWAVHDTAVALRKALKAVTSAAPAPVPEPTDGRDHKHGLQVQPTPDRDSPIQAANFQRPPNHVGLAAQRSLDDSSESEVVESEDEEAPPQLLKVQDRDPVTVGELPRLVAVARAQDDNDPPAPVFHLHTALPEAGGPPERSTSAPVRFHHLHAQMAQRTGATGSGNAVL